MALVTTPGSASANSYCTEAEADTYHEAHVDGAAWNSPADDAPDKEAALLQAARMLDAMFDWAGTVATIEQAMGWPRFGASDRQGRLIASDVVPQAVKDAQAELARQLLVEDRAADSDVETLGLKRVKAGVELEFDSAKVQAKPIPDAVFYLIGDLGALRQRGGFRAVPLVRG